MTRNYPLKRMKARLLTNIYAIFALVLTRFHRTRTGFQHKHRLCRNGHGGATWFIAHRAR